MNFDTPQRSPSADPCPALPAKTQWTYGIGEMGVVAPVSVSIFFLLFFLTQVVGLSPGQAGAILLVGRLWDAVNDPLVGVLSDVTPNFPRWGRRYPWIMGSAVPLAIACALQWWVPPLGQGGLLLYYGCMSILSYSFFTTVQIPFTALAAELTRDYDDRTRLMAFRSAFNILGSIVGLLLAKAIFALIQDPVSRYSVLGFVLGGLVVVGLAISVVGTYPHYQQMREQLPQSSKQSAKPKAREVSRYRVLLNQVKTLWQNIHFRWLTGLYLGSWMGVKTTAAVLPYFVTAWMGLPEQHFIQMALTVQLSSVLTTPFWSWLARRWNKRMVYLWGAPVSMLGLIGLFLVQPGQVAWMYGWGFVVGVGLSTFYLVPAAMLPDVIDVDAVNHGQRREGLFASVMVFLQKLALAIALFLTGVVLDWAGLVTGDSTGAAIAQPEQALLAIRWIMGPLPAISIGLGLLCAWFYPLTRELHEAIVRR